MDQRSSSVSFEIDTAKVKAAKQALGTKTLAETVDAALSEVVKLRQRETLAELLFRSGALELDDEVMSGAWREQDLLSSAE